MPKRIGLLEKGLRLEVVTVAGNVLDELLRAITAPVLPIDVRFGYVCDTGENLNMFEAFSAVKFPDPLDASFLTQAKWYCVPAVNAGVPVKVVTANVPVAVVSTSASAILLLGKPFESE